MTSIKLVVLKGISQPPKIVLVRNETIKIPFKLYLVRDAHRVGISLLLASFTWRCTINSQNNAQEVKQGRLSLGGKSKWQTHHEAPWSLTSYSWNFPTWATWLETMIRMSSLLENFWGREKGCVFFSTGDIHSLSVDLTCISIKGHWWFGPCLSYSLTPLDHCCQIFTFWLRQYWVSYYVKITIFYFIAVFLMTWDELPCEKLCSSFKTLL